MANVSFVQQSKSAENLLQTSRQYLEAQKAHVNVAGAVGGVSTGPAATASPPVVDKDEEIEPLEFAHVRPGDLITADFINRLIDVVIAIDTRLQRIENLLAPLIDRETKRLQQQANASPPVTEGKP